MQLFPLCSHVPAQFRGRFPVFCVHPGAHPILSRGPPSAPGPAAEPSAAPHSPAPSGSQRPPGHLTEPGPAAHGSRGRGPPWGSEGGPGESGWSLPVQRRRSRSVKVKSRQLGPHGGADPPQRAGRQVVLVSAMRFSLLCEMLHQEIYEVDKIKKMNPASYYSLIGQVRSLWGLLAVS